MISTALAKGTDLVMVDTDSDILFARDTTQPYYHYYYSNNEAVYMTLQDAIGNEIILKRTIQEIKKSLTGAEILDQSILKKVLEMLSE